MADHGKPTVEIRRYRETARDSLEVLKGSVTTYTGPTQLVAEDEWEAADLIVLGRGVRALAGGFHSDPADCLIVALARHYSVPLVTADARIRDYRYVKAVR